jgi:hypothetical protein
MSFGISNNLFIFVLNNQKMNNNLLSQEEVIEQVKPYAEKVYLKIFDGFNDYIEHDSDVSHIHDNTTKANIIRSRIINRIKELVLEYPTWQWVVKGRGIFIIIDGAIRLRCKKLSSRMRTENVKTGQVDSFRGQEKSSDIIAEKYINVDIAWMLNDFYSQIEEIFLVAPNNKKNLWRVQFKPEGVQVGRSIPLFTDSEEERKSLIEIAKVKPEFKKKKNKSDEAGQ